jgi:hypothetical protein
MEYFQPIFTQIPVTINAFEFRRCINARRADFPIADY